MLEGVRRRFCRAPPEKESHSGTPKRRIGDGKWLIGRGDEVEVLELLKTMAAEFE